MVITKNMVNTDYSLNECKTEELVLLNEFMECFASKLREIGCTDLIKMDIVDDDVPVRAKPYKPVQLKDRSLEIRCRNERNAA